jgi:hypothetical protein
MSKTVKEVALGRLCLAPVILYFALPGIVFAGGKEHPLQGTIIALGTTQETTGGGTSTVFTHVHRTYTVRTDTRVFVLECLYDMDALPIFAPRECGGKKKIAIGDVIHFRLNKNNAYVLTSQGKDEKLTVVSEAMNGGGTTVPVP